MFRLKKKMNVEFNHKTEKICVYKIKCIYKTVYQCMKLGIAKT